MVPITGARLQVLGADWRVHLAIPRVAHDEAVLGVPQSKTLGKALDGVEQAASLTVERLLSQPLFGAVADEDEIAVDCAVGLDRGLVDAPGIAVAEPQRVKPPLPLDGFAGEHALMKGLQLLVVLLAEHFGDGLADDLFSRHAEILGVLAVGIDVAAVAVDEGNARRDRVEESQELRLVEPGEAAGHPVAWGPRNGPYLTYI